MRILCENCSATYIIDDAQLGDQPIGVQCPYCGHVKIVRRGGAAPLSSDLGFSATASLDIGLDGDADLGHGPGARSSGGGAIPPGPSSSLDLGSGFDLELPTSSRRAAQELGFGGPPSGPAATRRDAAPGGPGPRAPSVERGGAFARSPALDLDGPFDDAGGPGPMGDAGVVCQECGAPLSDEFDKVIGLCEVHQRERRGADSHGFGGFSGVTAMWHARTPEGVQVGPLALDAMRERIRSGEVPLASQFSDDGSRFLPLSSFKELAYLASLGGRSGAFGARATYAPTRRRFDFGRLVTPVLAFAVLTGVGYLGWTQRADLLRVYHGIVNDPAPAGPRRTNPLRRYLASWRLAHPDVSGTAREHLRVAHELHLADVWASYEKAERAYQRALLLDENDAEAIAGYVENLAIWRYPLASAAEVEVARSALDYALELDGDPGPVHRAAGALAWAAGDLNGCRAGADAALDRGKTDARARLVLAGCYLEGNVQLAIREAELALRARPELKRAERILAEAYLRGGRFKSAYRVLDQRLAKDPRNAAVLITYGNVERALARYDRAEASYRRAANLEGDKQAAFLSLGQLALELGDSTQAADAFSRAARASPPSGPRGALLYAEWARAELARRRTRRAEKLAEQALKLHPRHVAALLVRAEVELQTGSATTAAALVKRALKEREEEPASLVLAARIDAKLGDMDAALAKARAAVRNDPKDVRLHGILAGQYLAAGRSPQAYAAMRKAVDLDPARAEVVDRNGPLSVSPEAVREAITWFERSARDPRNASVAYAAVGLLEDHLGNKAEARRWMRRAFEVDDGNVLALVYRAHFSLADGDLGEAERAANKLLLVERGSPLGHLYRARVLARKKAWTAAREDFQAALRGNPGLLTAEVELAALELESGAEGREAARQMIERAFNVEPDLLFLRRLLYEEELL